MKTLEKLSRQLEEQQESVEMLHAKLTAVQEGLKTDANKS